MKSTFLMICSYIIIICNSLVASDRACGSTSTATTPLEWTSTPLPFQKDLSPLAILTSPAQYNRDIARLAHVSEFMTLIAHTCPDIPEPTSFISPKHLARFLCTCSSNLGALLKKIWFNEVTLTAKEHEALIQLCEKSKMTIDNLPQDVKKDWHLRQCEESSCVATTSTNHNVRSLFSLKLVEAASTGSAQPATITFFASGELKQEHTLLKKLAKKSIPVRAVNVIDDAYSNLIYILNGKNSKPYIEISTNNSLSKQLQAHYLSPVIFFRMLSQTNLSEIKQNNQPKTISEAQKDAYARAFLETIGFFSYARSLEEFFNQTHKLHPEITSIRVYHNANDFIQDCKKNASLRPDILAGCDFRHIDSKKTNIDWPACWHDYHNIQDFCLKPTSIACSLQTTECNQAILNILEPNTSTPERLIYNTTGWRKFTERQTQFVEKFENKHRLPILQKELNRSLNDAHILQINYENAPTQSKAETMKDLLAERDMLNNNLHTSYKLEINHG